MKKPLLLGLILVFFFSACVRHSTRIVVIARESGSGTRSAFVALTGVERNGVDRTTRDAEIDSSTAVVVQTVAENPNAIAYLSVGALRKGVKALRIDGVLPSSANVRNGTYPISRPFYAVTGGKPRPAAQDFLNFIRSSAGQTVIGENGYVPLPTKEPFRSVRPRGTVLVEGSSSVAPVIEKLAEAYMARNPAVTVQLQTTDSGSALASAQNGLCDIGLSSRALRAEESGLNAMVICLDAIAVIVHPDNPLEGLTLAQLCDIFTGAVTDWAAFGKGGSAI